jgi:hypothetical protein
VSTDEEPPGRLLSPGQRCRVRVWNRDGSITTVHESTDRLYEAPNWTHDGRLILNGDGVLWSLPADGSADPTQIRIDGVPPLNNDHVLDPDGAHVHVSANDWHIWTAPVAGGSARRVTPDGGGMHFLHGVSPDGSELAYVRLDPSGENWWASATIHVIGVDGSDDRAVTTDPGPADGPEWMPDGSWIVFNTEQFTTEPGHAQIARVRPDGSGLERLTHSDRVDWFPHVAPTGDAAVFLSFPAGTTGHPADLPVRLHLVHAPGEAASWDASTVIVELFGGQGTLNVNGWAPDGSAFAFVDYPIGDPA